VCVCVCVYNHDVPNNKRSISKKCIYLFRFFILFSMTACTHLSPPLQCRRRRLYDDNDLSYDSIRFRYFSSRFFFYFLIILVVLVAAEVFLPIIFFVNWLGSHAARVSRRRRRNELADRLPPSSSLPFAISLLVALTVSHSFSQSTLFLVLSLSLSLSLVYAHYLTAAV